MCKVKNKELISDVIHYYEVRMSALSEYSDRVWKRFNWFLTLQLGVFGYYFSQLGKINLLATFEAIVPLIGIVVSILWLIMGIEDYLSMKKHGNITKEIEAKVLNMLSKNGINFNSNPQKKLINFSQAWLLFMFPSIIISLWVSISLLLNNHQLKLVG